MLEANSYQKKTLEILRSKQTHLISIASTGSGKGTLIELYAKNNPLHQILVVLPLIALGRQFEKRFQSHSLAAKCWMGEESLNLNKLSIQQFQIHLVSPEFLESKLDSFIKIKFDLVVVDECHCIFHWGVSFRPSYLELLYSIERLTYDRLLFLTATLPKSHLARLQEWKKSLTISGRFEWTSGLSLVQQEFSVQDRLYAIQNRLSYDSSSRGIIFLNSRALTEKLYQVLKPAFQKRLLVYHAGFGNEERRILEAHAAHSARVVLSTSAFGLGMSYQDISWVCLFSPPYSLLDFVQYCGRTARNGKQGLALSYWSSDDFISLRQMNKTHERQVELDFLEAFYAQKSHDKRLQFLQNYLV